MIPNLPPKITVNKNLASTIRNFIKNNGGKNVTEVQMNAILQRVAKFDAERDAGTREGGSIFDGGSRYLGGSGKDFQVTQGQQIQFSIEEYNAIFEGFIEPLKVDTQSVPQAPVIEESPKEETPVPAQAPELEQAPDEQLKEAAPEVKTQELDSKPAENNAKPDLNEQLDKNVKILFPNGLPEGVSANYVNIGSAPVLIFKKDGKTLDQSQLRELVKAQNQPTPKNEQVKDVEISTPQTEQAEAETVQTSAPPVEAQKTNKELSPEASQVMTEIKNLKSGEVYTFQKVQPSLDFIDGTLQNVQYSTVYDLSKDTDGNVTVKDQHNNISVYDNNGNIISSENDAVTFDIHNMLGNSHSSLRALDDYKNNTQIIDFSNLSLHQNNIDYFVDRISSLENSTVYNDAGDILFTSSASELSYNPQTGEDEKIYHFKDKNGKDLSKSEILELLNHNKLSRLTRDDAFDISYINENHSLEKDLFR